MPDSTEFSETHHRVDFVPQLLEDLGQMCYHQTPSLFFDNCEPSIMTSPGLLLLWVASTLGQANSVPNSAVDFRLHDHRGAWHALEEARERKLVVLAFVGTECPLANAYAPRLVELAKSYEARGVAFFGVDANPQDGPVAIGRFAEVHAIPFPILKDVGNELASRVGAERTPEVFVLDETRKVRYRGRIDDQFALGVHRPAPTKRELADAIEALLVGKAVDTPRTEAAGCRIGKVIKPAAAGEITYAKQVSRILQSRCVSCHRPG
jgi:peroxiredoxin